MDSNTRTFVKALTWQLLGLFSMSLVGYLFTRSIEASTGIAVASALTGFICYFFHERLWARVKWGRAQDLPTL